MAETLDVVDSGGKPAGRVALPEAVFGYPVKGHLLHEAVTASLANRRRGTAATKTRARVSGGGKKPWRQKGTGRARAGSSRNPLWRHGGTTFGPQPRDYTVELPRKARRNALKSALADKHALGRLVVVSELTLAEAKTKAAAALLAALKVAPSALLVDGAGNDALFRAMRNLPRSRAVAVGALNATEILRHEWLVLSQAAFASLMERFQ